MCYLKQAAQVTETKFTTVSYQQPAKGWSAVFQSRSRQLAAASGGKQVRCVLQRLHCRRHRCFSGCGRCVCDWFAQRSQATPPARNSIYTYMKKVHSLVSVFRHTSTHVDTHSDNRQTYTHARVHTRTHIHVHACIHMYISIHTKLPQALARTITQGD